jgi:hypothetical protein
MLLKQVVALAATHPTLVVDKGSRRILVRVRGFKNPTAAALHALEAAKYAPCTCWACELNEPCVAGQIVGSHDEVQL